MCDELGSGRGEWMGSWGGKLRRLAESRVPGRRELEGDQSGVLSVRYADHFNPSTGPAEPVSGPVLIAGGRPAPHDHSCGDSISAASIACIVNPNVPR